MPASGVIRWGAIAFMLGGLVWITFNVYALSQGGTPARPGPGFLAFYIVAVLFTNAGLLGFHALQQGSYGRLGRVALYTVLGSSALLIVSGLTLLFANTAVFTATYMIGLVGVLVGLILYGVATLRARVLPVWCGVLFIVFLPISIALGEYGNFFTGLALLVLGYVLWSRREAAATEQPSRVR
jgi:hypothetical protein